MRAIDPDLYHSRVRWLDVQGWCAIRARMSLADLGLIGNCQLAAHVRRDGAIVWCCMPRFDSAPIFGALLDDDGGQFTIGPATPGLGVQRYLANTNVLETRFESPEGAFRVLDFAPRFLQYERSFRPDQARPCRRAAGRHAADPRVVRSRCSAGRRRGRTGSSARTTSAIAAFRPRCASRPNAPLSYLDGEPFALTERQALRLLVGRAGRGAARAAVRAVPERDHRLLADVGEALRRAADLPGGSDPLGAGAEAPLLRGHRRDRRRADDVDSRVARARGAPGTTATAGCATPTTRSAPSACSGTSRSASSSSTSCSTSPRARRASISRRSTASTAAPISRSRSSRTGAATRASSRCASATAPRCTSSTTCSARWCWR